jgi:ankyrin repeat protein
MITDHGITALIYAAREGHAEPVTALLSGVSNPQQLVEQRDENGQTALIFAMFSSASTLIITKILESVVDAEKLIFYMDKHGLHSFTYSLRQGNIEVALLLFDKAKDKTALLLKTNSPNQPAAIQMMKLEIQDLFVKKYNEPKE